MQSKKVRFLQDFFFYSMEYIILGVKKLIILNSKLKLNQIKHHLVHKPIFYLKIYSAYKSKR